MEEEILIKEIMKKEEELNSNKEEEKLLEGTPNPTEKKKTGRPKKENPNEVVPISMPHELKIMLDNNSEAQANRSKFVCDAVKCYMDSKNTVDYIDV